MRPISISHLYSNDNPPSLSEQESARSRFQEYGKRLDVLEREINRVQEILCILEVEKKLLTERRTTCLQVLSPLRRIPPELIGEIALHSIFNCPSDHITTQVLTLSQVSRRWRCSILSMPVLFATCCINFKNLKSRSNWDNVINGASAWSKRASAIPGRTLYLTNVGLHSVFRSLLDPLLKGTGCKRLMVKISNAPLVLSDMLSRSIKDCRLLLDEVELLSLTDIGWDPSRLHPSSLFLEPFPPYVEFKALKELHVSTHGSFYHATLPVRWSQLTKIDISSCNNYLNNLAILRDCVNLETCALWIVTRRLHNTRSSGHHSPLLLPKLHTLEITVYNFFDWYLDDILGFLDPLRLPLLTDFTIKGKEQRITKTYAILDGLALFFVTSGCQLTQLTMIELCPFYDEAIQNFYDIYLPHGEMTVQQNGERKTFRPNQLVPIFTIVA